MVVGCGGVLVGVGRAFSHMVMRWERAIIFDFGTILGVDTLRIFTLICLHALFLRKL